MVAFLLIVPLVLLLAFGGFTGGWKLFDCWWSGGAVICGALLFSHRPVRFHLIGVMLIPAVAALVAGYDGTTIAFQNFTWWIIAVFLVFFIPSCGDTDLPSLLFRALGWCGAALCALYAVQGAFDVPVHGFGMLRGAEAQILIGSASAALFMPLSTRPIHRASRAAWLFMLAIGLYWNGSRSSVVGLGLLAAAYIILRYRTAARFAPLALMILALSIAIAAAGWMTAVRVANNPHAESRFQIYELSLQIFSDHPFGSGAGSFIQESLSRNFPTLDPRQMSQYSKVPNHAHNVMLHWAAAAGIFGMAAVFSMMIVSSVFLLMQARSASARWAHHAALAWSPALAFELLVNMSESLSFIRWLCLAGFISVTPAWTVAVTRKPSPAFRLSLIACGCALLWAGLNDLFARQALMSGRAVESLGDAAGAAKHYREAAQRRPWDVEPHLHLAQTGIKTGRFEEVRGSIEAAAQLAESPGSSKYFGSKFLAQLFRLRGDTADLQHSRHLILLNAESQRTDAPLWLESAGWARSYAERIWRLKQVIRLEPKAALAYDELAGYAARHGRPELAARFTGFAGLVRNAYGPGIADGLRTYHPLNRTVSRYESALIDKPGSL